MKVVMSSGHGKHIRGASYYIDEVDEARFVVEQAATALRSLGVEVVTFHDDVSNDQDENLDRICDFHNAQGAHDLDVSIHFNSATFDGSDHTSNPVGTEVFYKSSAGKEYATDVVNAIAEASGLKNRGPKTTGLYFLSHTNEVAILVEICFLNSRADVDIYQANFGDICAAIAEGITGGEVVGLPEPEPPEPSPPQPPTPDQIYPMLRKGDVGPWVRYMQVLLGTTTADGDFGNNTEDAVESFQGDNELGIDGICGDQTWMALLDQPAPAPPPDAFTVKQMATIRQIAMEAEIAGYSWDDRGVAPDGYTQGMALAYAQVYRKWKTGDSVATEMAKAKTSNEKDVLFQYAGFFRDAGMDNSEPGADTLRHLWALLLGLGMRESSGKHCEGRDMSADNVTSDTCEAGAWQTSYNAHSATSQFDKVMNEYDENRWDGYLSTFEIEVSCSSSSWDCYGSGSGYQFQEMAKSLPAFAAETCALTLRNLCNHYGPINRYEAELRPEADLMFKQVQDYVDSLEVTS